ncbi:MAG: sirohydrochlorin cobaltochelatase [Fusobacterium sp.]|nr:sirohydrochlorin cobaltochelatase [Fusobacterium sp.]
MKENNKKALLVVHFGTTHDDTREKTLNKMNKKFAEEFKDYDFFEAYTSRIVIKKLRNRDFYRETPKKILEDLVEKGYKELIVQTSHIIAGYEYEHLVKEVQEVADKFEVVKIGTPLLNSLADYKEIVNILAEEYVPKNKNEALVFVCHGTDSYVGSAYPMIEYVFEDLGYDDVYVVSTKGYPLMDSLLKKLKKNNIEAVKLAPFMFVAGEHAKKDMAIDFKEELEENGIKVNEVIMKGLGEFDGIQEIFLSHLKKSIELEESEIGKFKREYEARYIYK